ncbi:hypothetical protein AXF23_14650 [Prevotella sp. oral taxon 313]|jgi:hypothetical protein|uniref:hypothetical protein n=1 Tax=Prevotella sp. oral taxon 313 TaxID=652722 RepID=UPI000D1EF978|nr:hypothetical protein [Prevotella sp. oral taxon 313]PTL28150.1 hypothetical protein AXF23_14650 [Prevotella sp. oral taxon 313]DAS41058.1 MAG TPA: hypothetical protein [Caudoviricetes sp.]
MEEKKKTTDVAELQKENEELQKKVDDLTNQLKGQEYLTEAYKKAANDYKDYWMKNVNKIKKMKEDVDDIKKLTNKLIERW